MLASRRRMYGEVKASSSGFVAQTFSAQSWSEESRCCLARISKIKPMDGFNSDCVLSDSHSDTILCRVPMKTLRNLFASAALFSSFLLPLTAWGANQNATDDIEAESFDAAEGVENNGGVVGYLDNGDYLRYNQTNFGSGV